MSSFLRQPPYVFRPKGRPKVAQGPCHPVTQAIVIFRGRLRGFGPKARPVPRLRSNGTFSARAQTAKYITTHNLTSVSPKKTCLSPGTSGRSWITERKRKARTSLQGTLVNGEEAIRDSDFVDGQPGVALQVQGLSQVDLEVAVRAGHPFAAVHVDSCHPFL